MSPRAGRAVPPAGASRMRQRGFTLLELMIVIVIIGILATFVSLSIGNRALDDRLEAESQRLEQLLRLAEDEADLKGVAIGLSFGESNYRFLAVDNARNWVDYAESGLLRPRALLQPFYVELRVEGRLVPPAAAPPVEARTASAGAKAPDAKDAKDTKPPSTAAEKAAKAVQPQVLLLPGGQATPFTLDIRAPNYGSYFRIEADALGRFTRQRHFVDERPEARRS